MKLGDYYEGYYKGYMRYLAPGTAQGYDGDWRNHIAGEFGGWEMEDIRVRHINAWLASDHFAGIPGAARSAYKTLRQILRSAMGDELYSDEVVDPTTRGIRLPPMDTGYEAPYLRPAGDPRAGARPRRVGARGGRALRLWLGLRRSEQCGLQWGDIDLRTGIVHIRRGLQVIDGEVVETKVKTHRSRRPHMLPRSGRERLAEIKRGLRPRPGDWLLGKTPTPTATRGACAPGAGRTGCPTWPRSTSGIPSARCTRSPAPMKLKSRRCSATSPWPWATAT